MHLKIIAVYFVTYYLVVFLRLAQQNRAINITIMYGVYKEPCKIDLQPINYLPLVEAAQSWHRFKAEIVQLAMTGSIGTALNIILGFLS